MWLMITPFKGGWFSVARRHFIRRDEWLGIIRGYGVHTRKKHVNLKLTVPRYIESTFLHFIIETDSCRNCLAHWYPTVFRGTLKFRRGLADSASNATDKYNFDNFWHVYVLVPTYFVRPWKSRELHRTFRDVTPGSLSATDTCIVYYVTHFEASGNVILHTRYVSTCVGAGCGRGRGTMNKSYPRYTTTICVTCISLA
jgi:hypothetical protein